MRVLFCLLLSFNLSAQFVIDTIQVNPIYPSNVDSISIITRMHSLCGSDRLERNLSDLGDTLLIEDCVYAKVTSEVIFYDDTLKIEPRTIGIHYVKWMVNRSYTKPDCQQDDTLQEIRSYYVGFATLESLQKNPKTLIRITDLMGQEVQVEPNKLLLFHYSDGTIEKEFHCE